MTIEMQMFSLPFCTKNLTSRISTQPNPRESCKFPTQPVDGPSPRPTLRRHGDGDQLRSGICRRQVTHRSHCDADGRGGLGGGVDVWVGGDDHGSRWNVAAVVVGVTVTTSH